MDKIVYWGPKIYSWNYYFIIIIIIFSATMDSINGSTENLIGLFASPLVSSCACALLVLYAMNFVLSDSVNTLALVTANTLITNTYVWNLVTSCFFETSILKLLSDIGSLVLLANSIQIKNNEQFFLYFIFSLLACTIGTSIYCLVRFFSSGNEIMLISPIYGFNGVIMCILMFARQQRRDELGTVKSIRV